MKPTHALLALLALAIAAPTAHAQAVRVDGETDTFLHTETCIGVAACPPGTPQQAIQAYLRVDATASDAAAWATNASFSFWVPAAVAKPTAFAYRNQAQAAVPEGAINKTGSAEADLQRWTVDAKAAIPTIANGDKVSVLLMYQVIALEAKQRVAVAVPSLLVFADAGAGYAASVEGMPAFQPSEDRDHTIMQNTAAGHSYTVRFAEADGGGPSGGGSGSNVWLWAVGGAVVGFLFASMFVRRGGSRAKKFQKGGTMESKDLLEARRRTLMAAMKELEVAHEAKEVPDAAYSPLKEEYKAQAVRVMRTLEEKKEPPKGG